MSWIVDSRCAMAIVVRPAINARNASLIKHLRFGVDTGCRFVEDEDAWIERKRARERQQLFLSDR